MSETEAEKKAREEKEKAAGDHGKIVADLQKKLEDMGKMLEDGNKAKDELLKKIEDTQGMYTDPKYMKWLEEEEKGDKGSSDEGGDVDLNALSRTELVAHTQQGMKDVLTDMAKKMDEQMEGMRKAHYQLTQMADVEFEKIRDPKFAELLSTEEGRECFLSVADANKEWGAHKINEDMKKSDIVKEKEEADLKAKEAEDEKETWSEKPGAAASIAEEKDLTDEEIAGKAFDATFGTTSIVGEDEGGIVTD